MQLTRGDKLPPEARSEVLQSFIYRWTKDNADRERVWAKVHGKPTLPLQSDAEWLREHAFYVTDEGRLSRRHPYAEPAFILADL